MIVTRMVRTLDVSAASGLVAVGEQLFVVVDDELDLAIYRRGETGPGRRLALLPGVLPARPAARKAAKPDFETLALLPGALLALGSGATTRRARGALVPLATDGELLGPARAIDLAPLYRALAGELPGLNIEGAAATGDRLRLLHRAAGPSGENAVIELDLDGLLRDLADGCALDGALLCSVHRVALGSIDGVPLGFTDASPLPDGRLIFTAAAEDSPDSYRDGPCAGAVIGLLDDSGVVWIDPIDAPVKVEGVHATLTTDGRIELLLVADADDRAIPAPLLAATLPKGRR